jgi:DNA-binding GntR family transcriptional regulator
LKNGVPPDEQEDQPDLEKSTMLKTANAVAPRARKKPAAAKAETTGQPQSLTEKAYADLEEMIVTLQIPPGTAVSEASLSARLGIGRTPIREALQRLARERLVVILPQRGMFVSEINVKSQLRLLEVRRELERLMAKGAARRGTDEELKRFQEIAKELEKAARTSDDTQFMRLDREFNQLCTTAARNEFLANAIALIQSLSRRFWYVHYKQVGDMPQTARLHANVARAIAARDEAAAAKASDALLDYMEEFTRSSLDADR